MEMEQNTIMIDETQLQMIQICDKIEGMANSRYYTGNFLTDDGSYQKYLDKLGNLFKECKNEDKERYAMLKQIAEENLEYAYGYTDEVPKYCGRT